MAVTVALVGVGGYGAAHLQVLRPAMDDGSIRMVGGIDPCVELAPDRDDLVARGVALYPSLEAWHSGGGRADLVIVSSPIHFHREQACAALAAGASVLCEKPVAATLAEARQMARARDQAGRLLAVGYQWAFSSAIQNLKRDIGCGRFGRALRLRTCVAWPRHSGYYGRNNWAGKVRVGGRPVFDSPVSNATAHYLFNMLYLLGRGSPDSAAAVASVEAELYRANQVENFDAACMRLTTDDGVELLFYSAHSVERGGSPVFEFEFELGTLSYDGGDIVAAMRDGGSINYGSPNADAAQRKLDVTLAAVRGGSRETLCGVETAAKHTCVVEALQQMPVTVFAPAAIRVADTGDGHKLTYMPGLHEVMAAAYAGGKLFSECGVEWAAPARRLPAPQGF